MNLEMLQCISDNYIAPKLLESLKTKVTVINGAIRAAAFFIAIATRPDMEYVLKNGMGFVVNIKGSSCHIKATTRRQKESK